VLKGRGGRVVFLVHINKSFKFQITYLLCMVISSLVS
jgi:hypothetical protein